MNLLHTDFYAHFTGEFLRDIREHIIYLKKKNCIMLELKIYINTNFIKILNFLEKLDIMVQFIIQYIKQQFIIKKYIKSLLPTNI